MAISYAALSLFGPFVIGAFLNAILYGVFMVQCYMYYQTYKKDAKRVRCLVLYLAIMETCNTVINFGLIFEPLVLKFGNQQAFVVSPTSLVLDGISTVLISTPVQFFAAWRIYVVSESIIMPVIIVFFGTCSLIGGSALSISVSFIREWAGFQRFGGALITWLSASAAADVLITISLCWSLHRRKTGMKVTDDKVAKLVRLTMQTGLLTTIFALLDVILALTVHGASVNFALDLPLSKLYSNSLLSTLNARETWNGNLAVPSSNFNGMVSKSAKISTLAFHHTNVVETHIDDDDLERGSVESDHRVDFGAQ
ncbi:hypothetical protein GALMADRAFT_138763 [Galerina marginata CBS 339.88]|uniref:DUF6534 domain-containing protein n=1 Tax=Galerina marginata (strain CBS 339.88) TaxID=685588 RepID=A0A067TCR5_GALM3|nr:hypothetical protein GALMADRAFT_138763 [Galerina marginata CBS 339.88]